MSTRTGAPGPVALRIGELAGLAGTTPRTIRYYEEIGLLASPSAKQRAAGRHRTYREADLEHLREVLRLKELLGVSLEELKTLVHAEEARKAIRRELPAVEDPQRRRELLEAAQLHLDAQIELVRRRAAELAGLEADLTERRRLVGKRLREIG